MAVAKQTTQSGEYELFAAYCRTKDPKIRDELVNRYIYIAEILSRKFINRGLEYDDIYQVACMGVMCAIERFDPDRGVQFATFATPTVMGEIRRYFRDKGSFIKVPRRLCEVFYKAERVRRAMGNDQTSIAELSRILNISEKDLQDAYEIGDGAFIQSLEYEAYADGTLNIAQALGREDNHFIMIEDHDFIDYCMKVLKEKELEFIRLRYFEEKNQKQIAALWNVSQMYISRVEKKILKKLKMLYFRD
mgnify:CR=1 FL=1